MASLTARATRKVRRLVLSKTANIRSSLRTGIVGYGAIAPDHVNGYESSGMAHVVAINDVRAISLAAALDARPNIKTYKNLAEMFARERLDIVSVCTWPQNHVEIVAAAAAAGVRGIMCEKPLALQLSEVDSMLEVTAKHGCKLGGGHQYRFHPHFRRALRIINSGELGKIESVEGWIVGSLANNGPHLIDTIRFLLGDAPIVTVEAHCERVSGGWDRALPAEDSCVGMLTLESGVRCSLSLGDKARSFFAINVQGDRKRLEVTPSLVTVDGHKVSDDAEAEGGFRRTQFREFLEWVVGKRASYFADALSSAKTAEILLAMYESARVGTRVALPLANKGNVLRQLYPDPLPAVFSESTSFPQNHATQSASSALVSEGGSRVMKHWFSSDPLVGAAEWVGLSRVILSKQMNAVDGSEVRAFEKEFAAMYGAKHAVCSTSGTSAIHVALAALNLEPCDEVITTPITDMGSVIPILACNCIPVFADIDPETGNLTAASIEQKLTPKTKAVVLVHLFGRPADIQPILDLLRPRGIALIEDCCQAHYADYQGRKVGTYGDLGCFSFQQSKQMTCGDGGVTLVNRPDLVDRAALFVDKGWNRGQGLRTHLFLGMNYRMTELQGAVVRAQLRKLPRMIEQRRAMAALLTEQLRRISPLLVPPVVTAHSDPSWWTYPFSVDQSGGINIDEFYEELRAEGVRLARQYVPQAVFNYTVLKDQRTYGESRFPYSATNYEMPRIEDYPGFLEFKKNLLYMSWSHNVTAVHVTKIAAAMQKVITALSSSAARTATDRVVTAGSAVNAPAKLL